MLLVFVAKQQIVNNADTIQEAGAWRGAFLLFDKLVYSQKPDFLQSVRAKCGCFLVTTLFHASVSNNNLVKVKTSLTSKIFT